MTITPAGEGVVFEPLPERSGNRRSEGLERLTEVLPLLRAKPNQWARVASAEKGSLEANRLGYYAGRINRGRAAHFGADYAASVRLVDGRQTLYMRYTGDEEAK